MVPVVRADQPPLSQSVDAANDAEIIGILCKSFAVPRVSHVVLIALVCCRLSLSLILSFQSLPPPSLPFSLTFNNILLKLDKDVNGTCATRLN